MDKNEIQDTNSKFYNYNKNVFTEHNNCISVLKYIPGINRCIWLKTEVISEETLAFKKKYCFS